MQAVAVIGLGNAGSGGAAASARPHSSVRLAQR
jgi:hypothetical protein